MINVKMCQNTRNEEEKKLLFMLGSAVIHGQKVSA